MIWLLLALLFSTLIMVNFKLHPRFSIKTLQAITINYMTASVCGFLTIGEFPKVSITNESWSLLSVFSGVFLILVFFVFAQSAKKVGIALTSVSSKMSVIIPVLLGFFIFAEPTTMNKITGIIIALPAFYLILKTPKNDQTTLKRRYLILPILLFFGNGLNDSLLKIAQFNYLNTSDAHTRYLSYAFLVSLIIGTVILLIQLLIKKDKLHMPSLLSGILLGLLNWYSTLFFLKGLATMDVSVFIPLFNIGIVILGALTGTIIFREKLSVKNVIGFALAVCSIVLIAIANV